MEKRNSLFGTDGVRGVVGEFLTPQLSYKIGKALAVLANGEGKRVGKARILVCGDTRLSTDTIKQSLVAGALGHGADVVDAGILPTPAVSVITEVQNFDFGVMITASHNPPKYNGIKVFDSSGNKLCDEQIKKVEYILKNETDFGLQDYRKMGAFCKDETLASVYIDKVVNAIGISLAPFSVAIDCTNGACYKVAEEVFRKLGVNVVAFNNTCSGGDINVDCGALHPEFLQSAVKLGGFDLGFAYDGDGDRVVCVLGSGEVLDGDKMLFALAKAMKELGMLYGDKIVATILTNYGVEHSLLKLGVGLERVQVGDKNVSKSLQESKLPLGGEKAGHIIVSSFAKTGDGIFSGLYLLKLLKTLGKTLPEILSDLTIYPAVEQDVVVEAHEKERVMTNKKVLDAIDRAQGVIAERGRVVVRASGTENKVRILVEGEDEKMNTDIANFLAAAIEGNVKNCNITT